MPVTDPRASFAERLLTFEGYWTKYNATARQLAALGHVYDRPPLEALEEGSRCISCSKFIPRQTSIRALEHELDYEGSANLEFHHKGCERLQVRLPYSTDPRLDSLPRYTAWEIKDTLRRFRSRSSTSSSTTFANFNESQLLMLPVEIRLEIYRQLLPYLDPVTTISTIDRYSSRTQARDPKWASWPCFSTKNNSSVLSLLLSCGTIHDEFLEILFRSTTFRFENTKVLYLFLRQIGRRGRGALFSIDVTCGYRDDAMAFALLACCTSLKNLTIRRCCPINVGPVVSLWFGEGIACLLDISGLDKVVIQEYLEAEGESDAKPEVKRLRQHLTRARGSAEVLIASENEYSSV